MSILGIRDSGQKIVTNNLIFHLDAAQFRSYTSGSTTWNDLSGNAYNGTLTNGPTFNSSNGGSIVFDGSNDYATLPSGFANFTAGISIEVWLYATSTELAGNFDNILRLAGTGADTILVGRVTGGGNNSFFQVIVGGSSFATSQAQLNANTWYQWIYTANGTNTITYVNGALDRSNTDSKLPNNVTRDTNTIGGQTDWYTGRIAIIRVYNKALSATEIGQNYNAQRARFGL